MEGLVLGLRSRAWVWCSFCASGREKIRILPPGACSIYAGVSENRGPK